METIFDIGMHRGEDTELYLNKGFRVVGIEANERLFAACSERFRSFASDGQFIPLHRAVWSQSDIKIPFYINDIKDDWSSTSKGAAEKGQTTSVECKVTTISLPDLIDCYGVPYYIKCDVEGYDDQVAAQLRQLKDLPEYVSFEMNSIALLCILYRAGYRDFQIINQALNFTVIPPDPPREGLYYNKRFDGYTSGLFGRELDEDCWDNLAGAVDVYLKYRFLADNRPRLAQGWVDLHARRKLIPHN